MDRELAYLLGVTRRLPRFPHMSAVVNRIVKPLYLRRNRDRVVAESFGIAMELDPSECVDGWLLFCPQLYNCDEIRFVRKTLRAGDVFLDVGANIGYYSLVAAKAVGAMGRVLAIEADPYNWRKLARNVRLNGASNIEALNVGVSDKSEVLRLGLNTTGNRGGNSFLYAGGEGIDVQCFTLMELLRSSGVESIQCAKFDIEGFEFRVLRRFFEDAPLALLPKFMVIEDNPAKAARAGGDAMELVRSAGYGTVATTGENRLLEYRP